MFKLRLQAKKCLSCGVCQDVCVPAAIRMRAATGRSVEGAALTYLLLETPSNRERRKGPMETFPYLATADACTGCGDCIVQCPVGALELFRNGEPVLQAAAGSVCT